MLNLLAQGPWSESQVTCNSVPSSRPIIPEIESIIARTWTDHQGRLGSALFDGPMSRLESFASQDGKLILNLSTTSYRIFLGTNLCHAGLAAKFGLHALANAIGMSAALVTADNKLVMGRRNDRVAYYPNRIHPFAGALEPKDVPNVFDGMRRELAEELGLQASSLTDLNLLAIIQDKRLLQPEFIFIARTSRTAPDLCTSLDITEHRALFSCDATAASLMEQLERIDIEGHTGADEFTPVGVSTMIMLAQHCFGSGQTAAHVKRFFGGL